MLIYRIPNNISLINPSRSICPKCNNTIKWYENIPLFSYIFLKARCSKCQNKISLSYPITELIFAFSTLILYIKFDLSFDLFLILLFFYILAILSFIDLKYKAVPDYLLLVLFIISFFISKDSFFISLQNAMLFAGGFVLLNFIITFYIQNIKSRLLKNDSLKTQEALGEGDIPVIAAIAIILGAKLALIAIFLSALFAIIPAIYSSYTKKDIEIPFIPYLSLGLFCTFIFGNTILGLIG